MHRAPTIESDLRAEMSLLFDVVIVDGSNLCRGLVFVRQDRILGYNNLWEGMNDDRDAFHTSS